MAFETSGHVTAKINNGNKVTGQIKYFDCFGCNVSYISTTDVCKLQRVQYMKMTRGTNLMKEFYLLS